MNDEVRTEIGPFGMVPDWVLTADISDRAVRLYAVLAMHADRKDRSSFPRRRTLATKLGCSVDSVDRAVKELLDLGALTREHRIEDDRQTSNRWTVAQVQYPGRTTAAPGSGTDAAHPSRTGAAPGTRGPREPEPGEPETPATTAVAVAEYDPKKGMKIDGRNLPFDALVQVTNADERTEGGRIAKALKTIRAVVVDDSSPQTFEVAETGETHIATQIRARARLYRQRWPSVELTPTALAKNWSRVVTAQPGADLDSALEAAQRGIDSAKGDAP